MISALDQQLLRDLIDCAKHARDELSDGFECDNEDCCMAYDQGIYGRLDRAIQQFELKSKLLLELAA